MRRRAALTGNGAIRTAIAAALLGPSVAAPAQVVGNAATETRGSARIGVRIGVTTRQALLLGNGTLRPIRPLRATAADPTDIRAVAAGPASGRPVEASFIVTGEAAQSISIAVPATVEVTRVGSAQVMTVAIVTDLDQGDQRMAGGRLAFSIGGRLVPAPRMVAGSYRGLLTATAQYN